MRKLLLDTNFLMLPFEARMDLFSSLETLLGQPYQLLATQTSMDELKRISTLNNKRAIAAKSALSFTNNLIAANKLTVLKDSGFADDSIFSLAKKDGYTVCTNDEGLRMRLKNAKLTAIFLHNKSRLQMY